MAKILSGEKFEALKRTVTEGVKNGILESKMDVIKMQMTELELDASDLQALINKCANENKINNAIRNRSHAITATIIILIVLEWTIRLIFNNSEGFSFIGVLGLILLNIVTAVVIVFVFSYYINTSLRK